MSFIKHAYQEIKAIDPSITTDQFSITCGPISRQGFQTKLRTTAEILYTARSKSVTRKKLLVMM